MGNTHVYSGVRDHVTRKHSCIQKKRAMDIVDCLPRHVYDYDAVKHQIGNFDILLYRDMDPISRVIRAAESLTKGCGMFSHAALAVRGDLLVRYYNDERYHLSNPGQTPPAIDAEEIYVFESTLSGFWNDNVLDVHNHTFFGVQVRPLREQLHSSTRTVTWCPIKKMYGGGAIPDDHIMKTIAQFVGTGYNYHFIDLVTSAFPSGCCDTLRDKYGHTDDGLMFCSQLVAACLRHIGIIERHVRPHTVLPVDFLGTSADIPCLPASLVTLSVDDQEA